MGAIILLVGLLGVVVAVNAFSADANARRELRKAPKRKIAELRDGEVARLIGTVSSHVPPLAAPLTGRPCVYYIARLQTQSGAKRSWQTVITEERGVPFIITDDSGRAIIDPEGARVSLVTDRYTRNGTLEVNDGLLTAFLARHVKSGVLVPPYRYEEAAIEENELVAVLGSGVREPDPTATPTAAYRGESPTVLRLAGSRRHPLVISDSREGTHY